MPIKTSNDRIKPVNSLHREDSSDLIRQLLLNFSVYRETAGYSVATCMLLGDPVSLLLLLILGLIHIATESEIGLV